MKLSIITINYNNKKGLEKTIASVMSQSWRDFEWIIIDGGSIDGSKEIIEELTKNPNSNISYWCSEPDKGVYNAMNKGILHTKGDYLNFMNSGDSFHSNNTLYEVFSYEHDADILYGDWNKVYKERNELTKFPYPLEVYSFYYRNICHQAMFIKRDYHISHFYDESYKIIADHKNWTEAIINGASFEYLYTTICDYDTEGLSFVYAKESEKELLRLRKEVYPEPMRLSLEKLSYFENYHPYKRLRLLMEHGGIQKFLVMAFLKLMSLFFKVK